MSIFRQLSEREMINHKGIFHRRMTFFEAVALIVGVTIGAGILGVPYVIAPLGIFFGALYIVGVGLLMMGLN